MLLRIGSNVLLLSIGYAVSLTDFIFVAVMIMINAQWLLIVFFVCLRCLLFAFYNDFHLYSVDKYIFSLS